MPITLITHEMQSKEDWRPGVATRMMTSALTGAAQMTMFQQWCEPGLGAPTHLHAVEEILSVLAGEAELWVEQEKIRFVAGQSVVIPAGRRHGFRNTGSTILHVQAILASPIFEAAYDDKRETPRRYVPDVDGV